MFFLSLLMKPAAQEMESRAEAKRIFLVSQTILRILVIVFTVVSIVVMVTATQSVSVFGFRITAHYSDSVASKFLLGANAAVCAASVLSLILAAYNFMASTSKHSIYFFLFLHDMVMTMLMMAGCAAETATGYIARYGQPSMAWMAVCDKVALFCKKSSISLAFSYCACFCYFALTILSVNKLMSASPTSVGKLIGREERLPQA